MGYYTKFYLKAIDLKPSPDRPVFDEDFFNSLELCGFSADDKPWVDYGCLDGRLALGDGESYKWYEHDDEMKKVSEKYRDIVFILDGDGEESGDIWRAFYLNGHVHKWCLEIKLPEWSEGILRKFNG